MHDLDKNHPTDLEDLMFAAQDLIAWTVGVLFVMVVIGVALIAWWVLG